MTLQEVADELARRMECKVQPSDDPWAIKVTGTGYHFVVGTFFGGWQASMYLPDKPPKTFYAEAVDMLEIRLKALLTGRDPDF